MSELTYPDCIRELYDSEIFGEAAALAILRVARNDLERYHFGTLLQLETETKARLRPFLAGYGIDLSEDIELPDMDELAQGYVNSAFTDFVAALRPSVEGFLARFEAIAALGPDEDRDVLRSMVRHESAILRWIQLAGSGEIDGSLDAMIAELQYPLPVPC